MGLSEAIANKIRSCDPNPGTPTLKYGGISSKKNLIGGAIGIAFIILALILIVIKSIGIFNREKLTLTSFVQRDMSELSMGQYDVVFYLSKRTASGYVDIPYQFYSLFGVDVFLVEIYYNFNTHERSLTRHRMTPCFDDDHALVCAHNVTYKPICDMDEIDQDICPIIREYDVLVFPCDSSDPFCSPTLATGLLPVLFLRDSKFDVLNLNTDKIFQETMVNANAAPWLITLDPDERILYNVPVTKLIVESDESILPRTIDAFAKVNRTETFFFPKEDIQPIDRIRFTNALMDFYIMRSPFTESYTRSFGRVDEMLGEIFGLIGLLTLVVACLCAGYNDWSMKNYVRVELRKRRGEEEDPERQGNKFCLYLKDSWKQLDGSGEPNEEIDILIMHRNLDKAMEMLGKQHFEQEPTPTPMTEEEESHDTIEDENKQIKKSLISSEAVPSENPQRKSLKQ